MESWIWLIVALATLALEVATPASLISIWFSIGALFAYVAALLNLGILVEIGVFILMSIISFILVRPFVLKFITHKPYKTNADRFIGVQTKIVEEVFSDKWGAVTLEGIRWSVREVKNGVLTKDTLVEVVALEGAKLVVKQVS
jgi:membrane protein implicated in regulation of membrane protease activity